MKHSPGPWRHYDDSQDGKTNRHEIVAMGKTVCHIYLSVPDEDAANARLIAAAPDMLDALKEILELFEGKEDIKDYAGGGQLPNDAMRACMFARAAIAKAEGES